MRALIVLTALLAQACGSSSSSSGGSTRGDPRLVGEADYTVAQVASSGRQVAFRLGGSNDKAPPRLARDLAQGRRWLSIRRPLGFSFLGVDMLEGKLAFKPERASVSLVRQTGDSAGDPALLRLHGRIVAADVTRLLERIKEPDVEEEGLDGIDDQNLRILLGNGIDTVLGMVGADQGGSSEWDSREWINVVGPDGKAVEDWVDRVQRAIEAGSLDGIGELSVIAMRYRATERPKEAYFKFPFHLLAVAAQMKIESAGRDFRWIWEGLWRGDLEPSPGAAAAPAWPDAPEFTLSYKEYKPGRRARSGIWATMLKPVTLPVNYAAKAFDPYAGERGKDSGGWK